MKKVYITLLLALISLISFSQKSGHNIKIMVTGNENSFLSVAYHMGDKQYIKDTLYTDNLGRALFEGSDLLEKGLYMIIMPDNSYFELIISDNQNFGLSCSKSDFSGTLSFTGSDENNAFLSYQKGWRELQEKGQNIRQRLEKNRQISDSINILSTDQAELESKMVKYLTDISTEYKGTILSALLKAMLPVNIPEFDLPFDAPNPDSLKWVMAYTYNKDHYFDNIDLTDSRLIRTPVLYNKVNTFFSSVIIQHPDTVIKEMTRVIKLSEPDPQVFRFVIVYLFNHFRESQIMGHDAIVVNLADNYYLSGKVDWINEAFKSDLKNDVDKIRYNLIGKTAVDLTMETFTGNFKSLSDLRTEFTILYFWEPNCGHCKTTTPILKEVYNRIKPTGVEIFAICTQDNREEWESYIVENGLEWINGWDPYRDTHFDYYYNVNSTPMVYILDSEKRIIAKKLAVENIESFLENYKADRR